MSTHNNLYVINDIYTTNIKDVKTLVLTNDNESTTTITTSAITDYSLHFPTNGGTSGQVLTTDGTGILSWIDNGTTANPTFTNVTIDGNLTVSGTTTLINTTNLDITDRIITLNKGETGSSVTGDGLSGIEIDRGTGNKQQLLWDDSLDYWKVGEEGGTFYRLAQLENPIEEGTIPVYVTPGRLSSTQGLNAIVVQSLKNIIDINIEHIQWEYLNDLSADTINIETVSDLITNANITSSINRYNTSGGSIPGVFLPPANTSKGKSYTFVLVDNGNDINNTVTINANGLDTIEGVRTSIELKDSYQHVKLCSIGNGTWIIM